ncbi:hypothetical protein VE23_12465 [Paenibacillus sp. D9]|uniref:hypothetical protein n=1 Tax=Paenibacillus sp. D9 TaxID=665792 RepID=UPI00061EAD2D|nr:hypothetical protein [Paenibacillus sp. D9]KKC47737.1 hypothetical protein VE23_12465 [Paenibacillus sp. D9]
MSSAAPLIDSLAERQAWQEQLDQLAVDLIGFSRNFFAEQAAMLQLGVIRRMDGSVAAESFLESALRYRGVRILATGRS